MKGDKRVAIRLPGLWYVRANFLYSVGAAVVATRAVPADEDRVVGIGLVQQCPCVGHLPHKTRVKLVARIRSRLRLAVEVIGRPLRHCPRKGIEALAVVGRSVPLV